MELFIELKDFNGIVDNLAIVGSITLKDVDIPEELRKKILEKLGQTLDSDDVGFSIMGVS